MVKIDIMNLLWSDERFAMFCNFIASIVKKHRAHKKIVVTSSSVTVAF